MDTIAVIDFGGQYAHLIANRIRRLGVRSEVVLPNQIDEILKNCAEGDTSSCHSLREKNWKGIILSGGPASVLGKDSPTISQKIFGLGIPILAICYGHQLTTHLLGGKVKKGKTPEYGPAKLKITSASKLFAGVPKLSTVWMSHGDEVVNLPAGFEIVASTPDCRYAAVQGTGHRAQGTARKEKTVTCNLSPVYSVQFHPEVTHTSAGEKILANFVKLTNAKKSWTMDAFLSEEIRKIKTQVGTKKVFLLVSGGVDSTVAFALLEKALGSERVYGFFVDHGLLRENEVNLVTESLKRTGFQNLHVAREAPHFLAALRNVTDPEEKRRIIGRIFLTVTQKTLRRLRFNPNEWLLGQGTIYPDTIESAGTAHSDKIKTHHNRVPEIELMLAQGLIVEPLAELYKDEVREVGRKLKLPKELIERHPFPGPGLGVRILCAKEADKCKDALRIEAEIRRKWKVAGKVLPIKSVGVQGDARTYRHAVALFTSSRNWEKLGQIATEIVNKFPEINRVLLALNTSKAPRGMRAHAAYLTAARIRLLQTADGIANKILVQKKLYARAWQMPVVLVPVASDGIAESIILRPVESEEAMTAAFAKLPPAAVNEMGKQIAKLPGVEFVFYDLTNKPPATIEWE